MKILLLEDNPSDAELIERELRKEGLVFESKRVDTRDAFEREVMASKPDMILADYSIPGFDGMQALELARKLVPSIPFIIVTGSVSEEVAVECMKAGAADYVIKQHLVRVGPAVKSALERNRERLAKKKTDSEVHRLAAIVEGASDAIISRDLNGNVRSWNRGAERMYGYNASEIVGHPEPSLIPPDKLDEFARAVEQVRLGHPVERFETVRLRRDGTRFPVSASIAPIRDSGGKVTGTSVTTHDLTERQKLEEQILHFQKLESMGQLAGGIAHDFNNILASILGYTKLALQDLPEKGEARENLEEVVKAATRGRELVDQILTFSRQSKGSIKRAPHSLAELVQNTMKLLRPTIPSTVEIQINLEENTPPVLVDPTQMHQVLVNLCVNACHAMQNKGRLSVGLRKIVPDPRPLPKHPVSPPPDTSVVLSGACLLLEVEDTGHGMSPETLKRIFEPFFTTKKRGEGTGMGLAIVYGLVRGHGGDIRVQSQEGRGTKFQVYLPVHRADASHGQAPAPA